MSRRRLDLRPGVTNPKLWRPQRPPKSEWDQILKLVLERDDWRCAFCDHRARKWMNVHHLEDSASIDPNDLAPACVACHAVLHIGLNLIHGSIEIWNCDIPQVDVVRQTREGVRKGKSLDTLKDGFPIVQGPYPRNQFYMQMSYYCQWPISPEPICRSRCVQYS